MRVTSGVDGLARRWYSHRYNRPDLYGLAARLGWLPRRVRLALARQVGRLAPRLVPAERAAIRKTLAQFTGAMGSRLDALTAQVFVDFAMFFTPDQMTDALRQAGFRKIEHLTPEQADNVYFNGRRDGLRAPTMERLVSATVGY